MTKAKDKLEHLIFSSIKKHLIQGPVVVAVSGGRDSMALLQALLNVMPRNNLIVCHYHHGDAHNKKFRDKAEKLVKSWSQKLGLICETEKATIPLVSEAQCRRARNEFLCQIAKKHNTSIVVFAHHLDDWLETQLIKLIRGCSFDSLKQNLGWSKDKSIIKWRPWIQVEKTEILKYVAKNKIEFVDDPTNKQNIYLRNWIRNQWLTSLESFREGSKKSLAFSLIHSLEKINAKPRRQFPWDYKNSSISRLFFESLEESEKRQCLAYFFYRKKMTTVKRTQIEEIIKLLDKNQNELKLSFKTFEVIINAERVSILQKNTF
jgi:tRNA(Ile)-lysidine synthetase-like protein